MSGAFNRFIESQLPDSGVKEEPILLDDAEVENQAKVVE